jgi:hypothetical protein
VLHSIWLLPLVPLLMRWLPTRRGDDDRWHSGIDLGLAAALGVGGLAMAWLWMKGFYLQGVGVTASDFGEYCDMVVAQMGQGDGWSTNRSRLIPVLTAALAPQVGILDAFLWAAGISYAVIGAAVYLWARALHGRVAGISAATLLLTVSPVVILSRTLSFYPEVAALFTVCGAMTALAVRFPHPASMLAAGAGIGLALLADLRGLTWALPCLGLVLLGGWRMKPLKLLPVGLLCLALPIWASWKAGPTVYPPEDTNALEIQSDLRRMFRDRGHLPKNIDLFHPNELYLWGTSNPLSIPASLHEIRRIQKGLPKTMEQDHETTYNRKKRLDPWKGVGVGALALVVWGLRRRPLLLATALGTALPFAVALYGATLYLRSYVRFLGNTMPPLAVFLGIGFAALAQGALRRARDATQAPEAAESNRWRNVARPVAAFALCLALVLGAIPSYLSPEAPWRTRESSNAKEVGRYLAKAAGETSRGQLIRADCLSAVQTEVAEGGPHLVPADIPLK